MISSNGIYMGQLAKVTTTLSNYAILKNDTFLEVLLSKCLCVSRDRFPSSFFLLGGMVSKFGAGAFRSFLDQLVYFRNHASRVRIE